MKHYSTSSKLFGLLLVFAAILSFLDSCATGKNKRAAGAETLVSTSHKSPPAWIGVVPEEEDYFYFVGTSSDSESIDSAKGEAINDALSQVVAAIGITVTASSTYEERYFAEQYTASISAELVTEGKAKLQDAEIKEIYHEKYERANKTVFYRVWVLLKYSKQDIKNEQARLREIMQLKYGELKKLEEKAAEYLKQNRLYDAIVAHIQASIAALKIEDEGEVFFDRNMNSAAELLMQMRLEKSGEEQVGFVGKPLADPLRLKVYYSRGKDQVPLENVPVRFSYRIPKTKTAGYKLQVYDTVTNAEGTAELTVDMVYEVNDENRVEARIDLLPYTGQLQSVPPKLQDRVRTLNEIAGKKKAIFLFKSDTHAREIRTGYYFLQTDEDGSLIPKPVTGPVVYDALYKKKFSVKELEIAPSALYEKSDEEIWEKLLRSAGKSTGRVVLGYVTIVNYDTISGFHTARADARATLRDTETMETLKTWHIQRSGTGSSQDLARLNALTEIGRSLAEIMSNTMP